MTSRILAIGECMVELFPVGQGLFRQGFAGDTFNMAWYLRRLAPAGWQVEYLTDVGDDAMSAEMLGFMADQGIGTGQVRVRKGETVGLYLITLKGGERSFTYWRGQSAARGLARDAARLDAAFAGASMLVFSGITLAILSPSDRQRLLAALPRARGEGRRIAFDPNLRPRLWPDAEEMRRAIEEAAAVADVVLPSFDDERGAFGDPDPEATARRYRALGAGEVVVKNGAGEVVWKASEETGRWQPPPAERVVDTTAAGDSFNAGYLCARLQGHGIAASVEAGCRLAAHVIGATGALVTPPKADHGGQKPGVK